MQLQFCQWNSISLGKGADDFPSKSPSPLCPHTVSKSPVTYRSAILGTTESCREEILYFAKEDSLIKSKLPLLNKTSPKSNQKPPQNMGLDKLGHQNIPHCNRKIPHVEGSKSEGSNYCLLLNEKQNPLACVQPPLHEKILSWITGHEWRNNYSVRGLESRGAPLSLQHSFTCRREKMSVFISVSPYNFNPLTHMGVSFSGSHNLRIRYCQRLKELQRRRGTQENSTFHAQM